MEVLLAMQSINNLADVFFLKVKNILYAYTENPLGPKTRKDIIDVLEFCSGCVDLHPKSLHCIGSDEVSGSKKIYDESYQKRKIVENQKRKSELGQKIEVVQEKSCVFKNSVRGSKRDPDGD
ncbi:MAG: hypothetical protein AAB516_01465 [Patescibacteria group bacterium]